MTEDGQLYMWGRADAGQLGVDQAFLHTDSMGRVATTSMHVSYFQKNGRSVKQVACGEAHTLVLDSRGDVFAFGWSELGQLGAPTKKDA